MSELQLIEKIRSGDESALKTVYLRYKSEFLAWLKKYYDVEKSEASEIYLLTITAFYENIKKGKLTSLESQLKTYLFGIGKNKVKEYRRAFENKHLGIDNYYQLEPVEEIHDPQYYSPSEMQFLREGLTKLGNPCKMLLEAFYLDNKSMQEIATEYRYKNPSVVKTQKYKCIQRLKKIVQALLTTNGEQ